MNKKCTFVRDNLTLCHYAAADVQFPAGYKCLNLPDLAGSEHIVLYSRGKALKDDEFCAIFSCSRCIVKTLNQLKEAQVYVESVLSLRNNADRGSMCWVLLRPSWITKYTYYTDDIHVDWNVIPWRVAPLEDVVLVTNRLTGKSQVLARMLERYLRRLDIKNEQSHAVQPKRREERAHERVTWRVPDRYSDFTVTVDGKTYHLHRVKLVSVSGYFKALLEIGMKESAANHVDIAEMSSAHFEYFLMHAYDELLTLDISNVSHILTVADRLEARELRTMCIAWLQDRCNESPWSLLSGELYDIIDTHDELSYMNVIALHSLCPLRSEGRWIGERPFRSMPPSLEFDERSMASILKEKTKEIDRTASSVMVEAELCASLLDDAAISTEAPDHIKLSLKQAQNFKALLFKMVAHTSCSDEDLNTLSKRLRIYQVSSRSAECGPCALCKVSTLGPRDKWRLNPKDPIDMPGYYLCCSCFKRMEMPEVNPDQEEFSYETVARLSKRRRIEETDDSFFGTEE